MKADLHLHTKYSPCSNAEIKSVLDASQRQGLNIIAITDHNTITGALIAKKMNTYPDLKVIIGCEKKCEYGELLIYELKREIESKTFTGIIKEAQAQKARVFIAHPFDYFRIRTKWKNFSKEVISSIDGIEVLNGRNVFNYYGQRYYDSHADIKGVAGSDGHFPEEIGSTYVEYKEDLWKEIDSKKAVFVSNNNFSRKIKYLNKSLLNKWVFKH